MEFASGFTRGLFFFIIFIIMVMILTARRGRQLYLRRIPGLAAIDEATGRATEMGRPMLFTFGLMDIQTRGVIAMQALMVLGHIARRAARYATRLLVPCSDVPLYTMCDQVCREAYRSEGREEAYRAEDTRFISAEQFAYAAGTIGLIHREQVGSIFYFGEFYAESLLLAEEGQHAGALQIAGTPSTLQIPFFIAATDYVIIGDEYYAASAYISREPTLVGSLVGQDISKGLLVLLMLVGTALALGTELQPEVFGTWFSWLKTNLGYTL